MPRAKTARKTISKKLRFDIFKRDSFTCQYCGAHPPSAILHVDHIDPVANGGTNSIDNLVTSCQPCNSGKSANLLSDIPQTLAEKAMIVAEREMQIAGYQAVMKAKRLRLEDEAEAVNDTFRRFNNGYCLTETALVSVRMFIEKIGFHEVVDAMESACTRPSIRQGTEFKYFCGICWNIIKGSEHGSRT